MRTTILLLCLLLALPTTLYAQTGKEETKPQTVTTNFGAKAGFTAALSLLQDFNIGGMPVEQVQNDYKVGYFASFFMRVNFDRHFIQPEVSYNVNQCGVTFNKPQTNDLPIGSATPQKASINAKIHSIDIPIIYGYNFIKTDPYAMSVFGGPKFRYLWRHKSQITFVNFDQQDINEKLRPLNVSFTMGVAVTISRIFFDFRYDIGLLNMSKSITARRASDGTKGDEISYRRRDNVLSFSLGVFF